MAIKTPSLTITVTLRALQIFSSVVVLALSTVLIKEQLLDRVPTSQSFGIFAGALTLAVAIVGLVCEVWIEWVSGKILWVADAIAAAACFVGGTMLAIGIKMADCNNLEIWNIRTHIENNLFNRGCWQDYWVHACGDWPSDVRVYTTSRCKQCKADSVFMFFSSVLLLGGLVQGYLRMRKGD